MKGLIILSVALLILSSSNMTFYDIGLGDITVKPLSTFSFSTTIQINISGRITISLIVRGIGDLKIVAKFDQISVTLSLNIRKNITIDTNGTLFFELRVINYGLSEAKIFGNSTITIFEATQKNNIETSILPFLFSIILPLIILYIYERRKQFQISEEIEEVIVI